MHDEREIEAVVEVLRTSNLNLGPNVAACEAAVAALLAKPHGVMVNSGSSAIKLAIEVLDLAPGDEIVTPAVTFGTDVAPIVQAGLVPAFVDVDPTTFQVDAARHRGDGRAAHPCAARAEPRRQLSRLGRDPCGRRRARAAS